MWVLCVVWAGPEPSTHPGDLLFALGTVGSVSVVVALGAVDGAPLLEEAPLIQHRLTLGAGELLGVPGAAQRHQVAPPGDRSATL